jgi:hypothetical protein
MIHYHGLPITPATAAIKAVEAGHAFVSFAHPDQLGIAAEVCQSFAIDNGAFSAWRSGNPITDWSGFYDWATNCKLIPSCDFAVIPDVIDGTEADNDALLAEFPLPVWFGAPVWHLHESYNRLQKLAADYPRVCFGSSGQYANIGTTEWWVRMSGAMRSICDKEGRPLTKIHGLRMLNPAVFTKFPFASADSTNIGRNVGIDKSWKGNYMPPTKEARAMVMRSRIEAHNSPTTWSFNVPENNQGILLC